MSDYFINPYTFVGLRNGKTLCEDTPNDEMFTGKITCRIITKTQISIPDISIDKDKNGINMHPFFRIDNKAVIPGSSIRGVIRNTYEALTNSCMHINDKDKDYFSSRQNKQAPAILCKENGKYVLYEAKRIRVGLKLNDNERYREKHDREFIKSEINKQFSGFKVGDTVIIDGFKDNTEKITVDRMKKRNGTDMVFIKADTFINGKGTKTHNNPSVFVKDKRIAEIGSDAVKLLELNVEVYSSKTKNEYKNCMKDMKKGEKMLPVWYYNRGDKYYLAPSQISRSFFFDKPRDVIERMNYQACTNKTNMCEACALFGMISDSENSRASRVRFGDAVCESDNCFDKYYVLPVLGGPRISSFEFYLKSLKSYTYTEDKNSWYIVPFDPDEKSTVIAGRKFYWHHKNKVISDDDVNAIELAKVAKEKGKTNFSSKDNSHELVKRNQTFLFDVYFDRITEHQLKKLVFALNFGENIEESDLCHKIGHGKPVGLGSVKIVVDKILLRTYSHGEYMIDDVKQKYIQLNKDELFNEAEYEQVLKVVNMNTIQENCEIRYPVVLFDPKNRRKGDDAAYQWFSKNRSQLTDSGTIPFKRKLPELMSPDQLLPKNINKTNDKQQKVQLKNKF